jgi:uncharacterized RDD family membrane protein YckC
MFVRKCIAIVLDYILVILLFWAYCKLFVHWDAKAEGYVGRGTEMVLFLIIYCYFILTEYFFQQTPGKMLFRLKVVKTDGSKITFIDIVKRHLLDPVEILLAPPIAFIAVCATKKHQRIGDLIAKTEVVSTRPETVPSPITSVH